MYKRILESLIICLFFAAAIRSACFAGQNYSDFEKARKIEQEGKIGEAFVTYALIPGAEYAAVDIARGEPAKFIPVLDENDKAIKHFSRKDGLIANRVSSGVLFSDKIYFSSGWGDSGGGLIVYDQNSNVFTSLVESDGLPSNKIKSAAKEGNKLVLEFLSEYQRFGNFSYVRHSPAYFDPISRAIISGGEQNIITRNESRGWDKTEKREELPFLGGYIIDKIKHNDKTYLCGTRGLVIFSGESQSHLEIVQVDAHYTISNRQSLIKEAKDLNVIINNPVDLRRYLSHQNGFVRAEALSKLLRDVQLLESEEYINLLATLTNDSNINVRYTNVYFLSCIKNKKVVPLLKQYLEDSDPYIQAIAAIALARHDIVPDLSYFEKILKDPHAYGNLPFGASSSIGVVVSESDVYDVLAPHADKNIFRLLMKYPLSTGEYEIFAVLGKSLQRNPDSAEILLSVYDKEPYSWK